MYSKSIKIAFHWHFGRSHFCARTFKKSQISFKIVQNWPFSVRTLNLVLKRFTIGPIMHKSAIKHENIGFRDVFYPLSTRYNGIFSAWVGDFDCGILAWRVGVDCRASDGRLTGATLIGSIHRDWKLFDNQDKDEVIDFLLTSMNIDGVLGAVQN